MRPEELELYIERNTRRGRNGTYISDVPAFARALLSLLRDKEGGSSNASRAATRDHSLAAPDAEPSAAGCLLCAGMDGAQEFDYCRACGRIGTPLPLGAS